MGLARWTIAVLLALACCVGPDVRAAEAAPPAPSWPMWEPGESIEAYAKRAGLEPAQSFDLGNGETLEVVLLPAGSYRMGTPPPEEPPDRWYYGWAIMFLGLIFLVSFVTLVIARVYHKKAKLQLSLRHLLLVLLSLAVAMMGYMRWRENEARWRRYERDLETYNYTESNERPAHKVTLTRPVYIGKYEVTEGQFEKVWPTRPPPPPPDLRKAVSHVPFRQAEDWCHALSGQLDRVVRLPFEEEWEFAARGGTETPFFFGTSENLLGTYAHVYEGRGAAAHAVGLKQPNPFGLFDVYGNVSEWCYVRRRRYSDAEDAIGPDAELTDLATLRGGSSRASFQQARSARRGIFDSEWNYRGAAIFQGMGFRVVVELPPESKPPAQGPEGTK